MIGSKGRVQTAGTGMPGLPSLPVSLASVLPRFGNQTTVVHSVQGSGSSNDSKTAPMAKNDHRELVKIIPELCKGCELCVHACPSGNLTLSAGLNGKGYHPAVFSYEGTRGRCTSCGICYWVCPDMAISEIRRIKQ